MTKQIIVEDVLQMLKDGKTRAEIGEFYGLTAGGVKKLFTHPDLKGRRTHQKFDFVVVKKEDAVENAVEGQDVDPSQMSLLLRFDPLFRTHKFQECK